jgi:hypothetical protein
VRGVSRGPVSEKALSKALHIASLRGAVYFLQPGREVPAIFVIVNNQGVTFISVRMSRRIHCSGPDFEHMYRETIAHLRSVPASVAVTCELWLFSRYGRCRFFRVQPSGLLELACVGESA